MDYSKLRAQAFSHGEDEEAVTVNTRALIDKVLARYSGEWTTLRELLQNAADAQANTVKIKFETLPSTTVPLPNTNNQSDILKHTLLNTTLRRLLVTNDGLTFGTNDWARLKRIAEGNPDETKIGAFGVGFYSVFADCEEPFVSSGKEAMAFYWKGNSLFTRKVQLQEPTSDTTFVLDYRNTTSPIPNLTSLCQFLATSLTFVALQNIELWLDDWKILSLQKKAPPSVDVPIPRDVETKTKEGLMKVQSLTRESVQIDASFMNVVGWRPSSLPKSSTFGENSYGSGSELPSLRSFFSKLTANSSHQSAKAKAQREEKAMQEIALEDLTALTTANVFLSVTTATVRTSVSASFASELERATKKSPPKTTKLAILTSSYDEAAASKSAAKGDLMAKGVDIFASVLPGKKPGGRIFIGFPTHQTTGAGMHLSAPSVIPTVERESIDLNARWVRTWNIEMLRVAGIMARLAFTNEMNDLGAKVKRTAELAGRKKISKEDIEALMPEASHVLQTFTFSESTPSSQVSQIIEEAFWTTYKKPSIEVYSTQGVLPTTRVRLASEDLSGFVEGIPVVPENMQDVKFVQKLKDFGLLTEITIGDVKEELGAKALNREQLAQFVLWAGKKAVTGHIDPGTIQSLFDVVVATIGDDESSGDVITLSNIKYYRTPSRIPPDVPVPPTTLAFEFTRLSTDNELQALGWESLNIVPWLRFLVESIHGRNGLSADQDITWSAKFSGQVLAVLSKQWDSLSAGSKETVVSLLKHLTVIPTKFGMKIPSESYFESVKLFDDLPTVQGLNGVKAKFLSALGVRKTVELDTIFQRLLDPTPTAVEGEKGSKWSHVDLITYLASVKDDIPSEDLKKLRATPICAAEAGPPGQEASQGTTKRYKISELFEPKDALRGLGLPIIQWPSKAGYRNNSVEARFLTFLGLRSYPSVLELVDLMAVDDLVARNKAMHYFIANHHINGYASLNLASSTKAFLPLDGDHKRLVTPGECFVNEKAALLGFNVLRRDLVTHANKFGVSENPPMTDCVNRIIANPPQTRKDAISIFGYMSSRTGEIGHNHSIKLGEALIVPVAPKAHHTNGVPAEKHSEKRRYVAPRMCFIGDSETFRDIFDFVDFGTEANVFLLHCGSKHEPSRSQVASMLATEPARVLGIVQSPEKYLSLLRMLALSLADLKKDKVLFKQMKSSAFLLATREISGKSDKSKDIDLDDEEEGEGIKQWVLQAARNIVVVDDYSSYRIFKEALYCAPLEESLEDLYVALGASLISSLVEDDIRLGPTLENSDFANRTQKLILERTKIFLHEYPSEHLRHNRSWLEKNLHVEMVSSITLRRSLRGYNTSHKARLTATLKQDPRKGWVLWITANVDMYHISQALVRQLLTRPTNQAATLLEFLLTSDLQGLKRRGYNVDRILRAQAAEARIAEEERQKQLEIEQQQIKEQEEQWKRSQAAPAARDDRRKSDQVAMPGAFGSDSPQQPVNTDSTVVAPPKRSRGLFSNLTRRLGIDNSDDDHTEAQQQLQNFLGNQGLLQNKPPPPYDPSTSSGSQRQVTQRPPGETEKVTNPAALHQNLLNAIRSSRAHDSRALFSPPHTREIKEQASYCDANSAHNIVQAGTTANGTRIFVAKDLSVSPEAVLSLNAGALNAFASLLHDVSDIFSLSRRAMHIFYDEQGSTIAFNAEGSIFANARFWLQLHWEKVRYAEGAVKANALVEAASWWWIVVAHELAHNIVKEHSAEHSYYTEMFIAQYFSKMMTKALGYQAGAEAQPQSSAQRLIEGNENPPSGYRSAPASAYANGSASGSTSGGGFSAMPSAPSFAPPSYNEDTWSGFGTSSGGGGGFGDSGGGGGGGSGGGDSLL